MAKRTSNPLLELSKVKSSIEERINERLNFNREYRGYQHDLHILANNDKIVITNIIHPLNHKQINGISRIIGIKNYEIIPLSTKGFNIVYDGGKDLEEVEQ